MTMKTINKSLLVLLTFFIAAACTYEFPETPQPQAGQADFTKMIAVGNSLTAGFMNNALYTAGQNASFVKIMAKQMETVGGGAFNQADIGSVNGCSNPGGGCTQGRLYLKYSDFPTSTSAGPVYSIGSFGNLLTALTAEQKAALNNFGVPGASILSATNAGLSANPHYERIASAPGTSTLIGDAATALAAGGTFFTFWLGNNDVLGYATGGAADENALTGTDLFNAAYDAAINAILAANANAKGAVANIPDVTSIPYFRTVPYNPVPLDEATADLLNGANGFGGYNAALEGLKNPAFGGAFGTPEQLDARKITFAAGSNNRLVIVDEHLPSLADGFDALLGIGAITPEQRTALTPYEQARQTTSNDLIVLPAASFIGTTVGGNPLLINGVSVPLGDQWVVTPTEKQTIQNRVNAFNSKISDVVAANSNRLVLVNIHDILNQLAETGVPINGSTLTASITPPFGAFSLDGVHPNARGHAFIANQFIEAINAKFKSSIPLCNPNDFAGNELPVP